MIWILLGLLVLALLFVSFIVYLVFSDDFNITYDLDTNPKNIEYWNIKE